MHPSQSVLSASSDRLFENQVMACVLVRWRGPIFDVEGECRKLFH
jgi:hypothetical protein